MKYFIIIVMLAGFLTGRGQDTLLRTYDEGVREKVMVKILHVNSLRIKYRYWDDLQGPWFYLKTKKAVRIFYQDGRVYTGDNEYDSAYNALHVGRVDLKSSTREIVPPARSASVIDSLYRHSFYALPDTLFCLHDSALAVRILGGSRTYIIFARWDNLMGPQQAISVDSMEKVKYQDGDIAYQSDFKKAGSWARKWDLVHDREKAKPGYYADLHQDDLFLKREIKCRSAGLGLLIPGIYTTFGGVVLRVVAATYTPPDPNPRATEVRQFQTTDRRCLVAGATLMPVGVAEIACGIAGFILSHKYAKKYYWVMRKMVAVSYPQPSLLWLTAQNNFQKGFAINTGLVF